MRYTPIKPLPRGAVVKVAKAFGYSVTLVSAVARGTRVNARIYEALLLVAREEAQRLRRIERLKRQVSGTKSKDSKQ